MANFSRNSKKQTAIRTDEQQNFSVNEQPPADMGTIELLEQMRQVNEAVKANKLSTILGEQIYDLCKVLMRFGRGKQLEEKHKADLNNFFASIRQAACRENGELGLPCRLKVLELVELRVMGWRPNLSFAQYYSKKEKELQRSSNSDEVLKPQSGNAKNESSLAEIQHLLMPCKSAPAVAASSNSPSSPAPFSPFAQPPPPPNTMPPASSGLLNSMDIPMPLPPPALHPPTAPGFFFIPSRGGGTFIPVDFPPPPHFPSPCGPLFPHLPPPQLIPAPSRLFPINQMPPNVQQQKSLSNLLGERSEPAAKGKSAAAAAAQQFREEITIRNSDSGKVMGVKGRRVALIEELSQTVISFQKVDPKCKDRQLTVIADNRAAVECAKRLIGQTIERNVSPERPAGEVESSADHLVLDAEKSQSNGPKTTGLTGSSFHVGKESDGSLKIVAQDPAFLAAAQDALSDYLARIAAVLANQKKTIGVGEEAGPEEEGKVDSAGSPAGKSKGRAYERAELLAIRRSVEANQKLAEEAKRRLHGLDILLDAGTTELTKLN